MPARLSASFWVWLRPGASMGWYEALAGFSWTPRSLTSWEGLPGTSPGRVVKPEWHLKQSWYSAVTGATVPSSQV